MRFDRPSPGPPLSRASLVIGLYGALALIALMLSSGRGDPDVYRMADRPGWVLLLSPLLGVVLGLAVVIASRIAVTHLEWARALHRAFRDLLGPLTNREILVLAASSAIGEELLFRGALMPWFGLIPSTLAFGLLHIGPGVRFLPWTVSALAMGFAFGALAQATGDLGGPIAAHFVINLLNLRFITRP